jgi:predicted nucleic acid-binding protein
VQENVLDSAAPEYISDRAGPKYILDACALLALFDEEKGADIVEDLLNRAKRNEITLIMNAANLIEVYYDRIREAGKERADSIIRDMYDTFPVFIIETLSPDIVREAAGFKAAGKMSFADTILVATAVCTDTTIVTCDHVELEPVEKQGIVPFLWIRQRF